MEQAILSLLLQQVPEGAAAMGVLTPECFTTPKNQALFAAINHLNQQGLPYDLVSVIAELRRTGKLDAVGGEAGVASYLSIPASHLSIMHYVHTLIAEVQQRMLSVASSQLTTNLASSDKSASDALAIFHSAIDKVQDLTASLASRPELLTDIQQRLREQGTLEQAEGVTFRFPRFDHLVHGLQAGNLCILAARPGDGKSALALTWATQAACRAVAFFSLEMSKDELARRFMRMRIDSPTPVYIDEAGARTLADLRLRARRLVREKGVGMIVVDYLQLMRAPERMYSTREQEVASFAHGLKQLASELQVPVVALAQLNRDIDRRRSGSTLARPVLSDLRESGAIEQDADLVVFLQRRPKELDEMENGERKNANGELENGAERARIRDLENAEDGKQDALLIIAKFRSGPTADIPLHFLPRQTRFEERT